MFPDERSLVNRLAGKQFALIGVNSDTDQEMIKKRLKEHRISWRSFWNGPKGTNGPISKAWKVRSWPDIYVLDEAGVIRYKGVKGKAMDDAVDTLLAEMEKK